VGLLLDHRRENDRTPARPPVTEPVLLDLARKFESPAADEDGLALPVDTAPAAWIAARLPRPEPGCNN
jgi:hypothetical protein